MRKIETQAIGGDQGALLLYVGAKHLSQGCVQQMRRGVIERDGGSALLVDLGLDGISHAQLAGVEHSYMRKRRTDFLRVAHGETRRLPNEYAGIADLAAAFSVKGRVIEHHLPFLTGTQCINDGA